MNADSNKFGELGEIFLGLIGVSIVWRYLVISLDYTLISNSIMSNTHRTT